MPSRAMMLRPRPARCTPPSRHESCSPFVARRGSARRSGTVITPTRVRDCVSWSPLRIAALVLALLAVILAGVAQIVPLATYEEEQTGVRAEAKAYAWRAYVFASGFGIERSDSTSWYDEDFDDEAGADMMRAASPLLVAGAVLVLASLALLAIQRVPALILALVGAVLLAVGDVLAFTGLKDFFDDRQEWALGIWLAVAAAVFAAVAGLLLLFEQPRDDVPTFGSPPGAP